MSEHDDALPPILSDDEIVDMVRDADLDWHAGYPVGEDENRYSTFARAVEQRVVAALAARTAVPVIVLYKGPRTMLHAKVLAVHYDDTQTVVTIETPRGAPPAPSHEAMRGALEALDDALWYVDGGSGGPAPAIGSKARKAIALLRAALGE